METKQKKTQNLSDEERQRRRDRMLALRAKLKKVKEDTVLSDGEGDDAAVKTEQKPQKKPPPTVQEIAKHKKTNLKPPPKEEDDTQPLGRVRKDKKTPKKVIKIKYYGDVSHREMEYDNMMINNIHTSDVNKVNNNKNVKEEDKYAKWRKQLYGGDSD